GPIGRNTVACGPVLILAHVSTVACNNNPAAPLNGSRLSLASSVGRDDAGLISSRSEQLHVLAETPSPRGWGEGATLRPPFYFLAPFRNPDTASSPSRRIRTLFA